MTEPLIQGIDLFCGAGGLSLGLQQAGINIVLGIDNNPACKWAYEHNIHAPFLEASVRDVEAKDLNKVWADAPYRLLAGCAPCQPFSQQRRGRDTSEEEAWDLLDEFGRLVRQTRPEFVTMENVAPLRFQPVFERFLSTLRECGYWVDYTVLKGEKHGLAQTRRRLVLVASALGSIEIPEDSGVAAPSVNDVLRGLPTLVAGQADPHDRLHYARALSPINLARIRASIPGGTWRDWPEELRAPCHRKASGASFQSFYGVIDGTKLGPTITTEFYNYGSGRFGHPSQPRTLTPREAALLQGFPRDFEFIAPWEKPRLTRLGKLIGNAVPPPFGKHVGTLIMSCVINDEVAEH